MTEYKIFLDLDNEARLEMLLFSHEEHRWLFRHHFVSPAGRRLGKPDMINDTTLSVNYDNGVAGEINVAMDIVFPKRMGKTFLYGLDISKDSHLFVEFEYEKKGLLYQMKSIEAGNHGRLDFGDVKDGLVKQVNFPFPVRDRVEIESGTYRVPFLRSTGEEALFEFPEDYRREI